MFYVLVFAVIPGTNDTDPFNKELTRQAVASADSVVVRIRSVLLCYIYRLWF